MKHQIPLGTKVSFEGESLVYIVSDYQDVLGPCPSDCNSDHDHYEEAYICVTQETGRAFPLSKLKHIFDPITHYGREATINERTPR